MVVTLALASWGGLQGWLPASAQGNVTITVDKVEAGPDGKNYAYVTVRDENGDQVYVLYDMASSNGTFAGAKESYKEDASRVYRHVLQDGDYVLIGETTLVFKRV